MELDAKICEQARQARDPRFDGRFFIGVKTTGIYCRPICPVRLPKSKNVVFFKTAASASESGFRPCMRCRPESAPGTPAWHGTSTTVRRALRLIHDGALDRFPLNSLAETLGLSPRHLRRLFQEHLGASPQAIIKTRRLNFAKKLIDETSLTMTQIAMAAGYGSVRRFNDHFRQVYQRSPSELKSKRVESNPSDSDLSDFNHNSVTLSLSYQPPYHWPAMIAFFEKRALLGIEWVASGAWHRHIRIDGRLGKIEVRHLPEKRSLRCKLDIPTTQSILQIVERIRKVFDIHVDPLDVDGVLAQDSKLWFLAKKHPGIRVPGAWDGFEVAVRAIVGQQISVAAATTTMNKIVKQFGIPIGGRKLFPNPETLARAKPEKIPMPRTRAQAIIDLSQAISAGDIVLDASMDASIGSEPLMHQLTTIKGIGHWTATYVAMRVMSDPDAFLHSDGVLLRVAKHVFGDEKPQTLLRRSMAWRPWRAYAGMILWQSAK